MQTVVIETILWQGSTGGAIFNAHTADGSRHRILANARTMPRPPISGEVWDIEGVIRQHPVHGPQVEASRALLRTPSGRLIVNALSGSSRFPGIGLARATALWEEFGEELYALLSAGTPEPFEEALGPALARVIVQGWRSLGTEASVYRWLDVHGLPVRLSARLLAIYGDELIAKLEENPYRLLAFTSWAQADRIGRALGIARDDPRRLIASAEAACYHRLDLAHTWTPFPQFLSNVVHLLGGDRVLAARASDLAKDVFAIVPVGEGVQGLGPFSMEQFIASRIRAMVNGDFQATQMTIRQEPTAEDIADILGLFTARHKLILNPAQREAVRLAVTSPISCITGGAGVGKTTVLKAVHLAAEVLGFSGIYQMALSGRAAKRMTEATGRPASTITAFLNGIDTRQMHLDGEVLLIVDEASMLDLPNCYRIMRRMSPGTRLLLVGDASQLPPIGFGLTFHTLVNHPDVPSVELTEVHRAAAATGIPQVSVAVRRGEVPALGPYVGKANGVSFIDASPDEILERIWEVWNEMGGEGSCQIVGAIKRGPAGVMTINGFFHDILTMEQPQFYGFADGEPVLWLENDYERGLYNGSLGRIVRATDGLSAAFDGVVHQIDAADAREMEYAYAITVHKSQGSQFERVIVPVLPSRILDRTLLYTAVTRAEKQVVLIGDRAVFELAVTGATRSSLRQTGLAWHLKKTK